MPASHLIRAGLALCFFLTWVGLAETTLSLEDFETEVARVEFTAGGEFPGATGRFERTPAAAHGGGHGGRLHFDFSNGGRYVGVLIRPTQPPERIAESANALALWIRRPSGPELALR